MSDVDEIVLLRIEEAISECDSADAILALSRVMADLAERLLAKERLH